MAASLGHAPHARAQALPAARSSADELTTLEKNLAREHATLSTADCTTACRALASIRRAADRICALDPDERCVAARAKADDATRRVRDACPECALASAPTLPTAPEQPTAKPAPDAPTHRPATKGGTPSPHDESARVAATSAPPAESKRGGCAGCTTSGTTPGDLSTVGLALAALAVVMRRRAPRRPRA